MPRQDATAFDKVSTIDRLDHVSLGGMIMAKLYSLAEVAKAAGVSRQTIYNWLAADPPLVRHSHEVGGAPVFTRAELDAAARVAEDRRARTKSLRLGGR